MDTILVVLIVASAALYLFFRFKKALKNGECPGGCSGCTMSHNCPGSKKDEKKEE